MNDAIQSQLKRPRGLLLLTLLLALFQAGAVVRALQMPARLAAGVSVWLPLEIVVGALWTAASAWATMALWQRKPRATLCARWLTVGFILYSLARLVIFARADYDRQRLPFLLAATFFVLIVLMPVSSLVRSVRLRGGSMETVEHGSKP